MRKLIFNKFHIAFLIFLLFWCFRVFKINEIIQNGVLADFLGYYNAARTVIVGKPDDFLIVKSTFGPPFVLLSYIPFALFSFKTAEYLLTITNLISYFLVFYLLWKKYYVKITWFFWLYLGLLSFSFPLIFSLGMGNPVGIVTLGIYSFWIFKYEWIKWPIFIISIILKIFPIAILPLFIFSVDKLGKIKFNKSNAKWLLLVLSSAILLVLIFIPLGAWIKYFQTAGNLSSNIINPDTVIYNQSFSSSLMRIGFLAPSFSLFYWLFASILLIILARFLWRFKIREFGKTNSLDIAIVLLCISLLFHPFPWQYYFAVFLPYLMIKIHEGKNYYILIFLLLSIDGNLFHFEGILKGLINSSQFFGTIFLLLSITNEYLIKTTKNYLKIR